MSVYNVYHLEYLIIIYDPVFRPRGPSSGLSFFGLFREPRPGPGGPRVCVGDASCVSSSPDFPARLRVVALFFLLSFLAPFLVSFLLCLFLFFALRLPRRRAGWLRSRQDSFCRGPSLGLFLIVQPLIAHKHASAKSLVCSILKGAPNSGIEPLFVTVWGTQIFKHQTQKQKT